MGRERDRELEERVSYCQRKELTLKMDRRVTLASEHTYELYVFGTSSLKCWLFRYMVMGGVQSSGGENTIEYTDVVL